MLIPVNKLYILSYLFQDFSIFHLYSKIQFKGNSLLTIPILADLVVFENFYNYLSNILFFRRVRYVQKNRKI